MANIKDNKMKYKPLPFKDNIYGFYELPEHERAALIGQIFKDKRGVFYFPVGLLNPWENYNSPQGLVFVSPIWPGGKNNYYPFDTYEAWFRVGVTSPDDLDMDLDFIGQHEIKYRKKVIKFIKNFNKEKILYRGLMLAVQDHVKCGTLN